jgi:hypothetical protein
MGLVDRGVDDFLPPGLGAGFPDVFDLDFWDWDDLAPPDASANGFRDDFTDKRIGTPGISKLSRIELIIYRL